MKISIQRQCESLKVLKQVCAGLYEGWSTEVKGAELG